MVKAGHQAVDKGPWCPPCPSQLMTHARHNATTNPLTQKFHLRVNPQVTAVASWALLLGVTARDVLQAAMKWSPKQPQERGGQGSPATANCEGPSRLARPLSSCQGPRDLLGLGGPCAFRANSSWSHSEGGVSQPGKIKCRLLYPVWPASNQSSGLAGDSEEDLGVGGGGWKGDSLGPHAHLPHLVVTAYPSSAVTFCP